MAALGRKIEKGDQENRISYMRQIGKIWNGCFRKEGKKKDERHRTIQDLEMHTRKFLLSFICKNKEI